MKDRFIKILSAKQIGNQWTAKCPAHDDKNPSLSIKETSTGRLLWKCHAGCSQMAVFEALVAIGVLPSKKGGGN